jgi:hypothetical protein
VPLIVVTYAAQVIERSILQPLGKLSCQLLNNVKKLQHRHIFRLRTWVYRVLPKGVLGWYPVPTEYRLGGYAAYPWDPGKTRVPAYIIPEWGYSAPRTN